MQAAGCQEPSRGCGQWPALPLPGLRAKVCRPMLSCPPVAFLEYLTTKLAVGVFLRSCAPKLG